MLADDAVTDIQFDRGLGKTGVPGSNLENAQRIQMPEGVFHEFSVGKSFAEGKLNPFFRRPWES